MDAELQKFSLGIYNPFVTGYELQKFSLGIYNPFVTGYETQAFSTLVEVDESVALQNYSADIIEIVITSIYPVSGYPGDEVTLSGRNFGNIIGSSKVYFSKSVVNNQTVMWTEAEVVSWSDTEVKVKVPVDAVSGDVYIFRDSEGIIGKSNRVVFYVLGEAICKKWDTDWSGWSLNNVEYVSNVGLRLKSKTVKDIILKAIYGARDRANIDKIVDMQWDKENSQLVVLALAYDGQFYLYSLKDGVWNRSDRPVKCYMGSHGFSHPFPQFCFFNHKIITPIIRSGTVYFWEFDSSLKFQREISTNVTFEDNPEFYKRCTIATYDSKIYFLYCQYLGYTGETKLAVLSSDFQIHPENYENVFYQPVGTIYDNHHYDFWYNGQNPYRVYSSEQKIPYLLGPFGLASIVKDEKHGIICVYNDLMVYDPFVGGGSIMKLSVDIRDNFALRIDWGGRPEMGIYKYDGTNWQGFYSEKPGAIYYPWYISYGAVFGKDSKTVYGVPVESKDIIYELKIIEKEYYSSGSASYTWTPKQGVKFKNWTSSVAANVPEKTSISIRYNEKENPADIGETESVKIDISMQTEDTTIIPSIKSLQVCAIPTPSVRITYPNGGERVNRDDVITITWEKLCPVDTFRIYFSSDGGRNWAQIGSTSSTSFSWIVPNIATEEGLIKVEAYKGTEKIGEDTSDSTFTICLTTYTINVTYPDGGEILEIGETYNITWTSEGNYAKYTIYFSSNSGQRWTKIDDAYSSPYAWRVDVSPTESALIKVVGYNSLGTALASDTSNSIFKIIQKSIKVIRPSVGDIIERGTSYTIEWEKTGTFSSFDLYYSTDNGQTYTTIVTGISSSTTSYNWNVPNIFSHCYIKIIGHSAGGDVISYSGKFVVVNPDVQINITSPRPERIYATGDMVGISWTLSDPTYFSSVLVKYCFPYADTAEKRAERLIVQTTNASPNTFIWTIPFFSERCVLIIVAGLDSGGNEITRDQVMIYVRASNAVTGFVTPKPGDQLSPGAECNISWYIRGYYDYVCLDYARDYTDPFSESDPGWINIVSNYVGTQYRFTLPTSEGPIYFRLRVYQIVGGESVLDIMDWTNAYIRESTYYFRFVSPYPNQVFYTDPKTRRATVPIVYETNSPHVHDMLAWSRDENPNKDIPLPLNKPIWALNRNWFEILTYCGWSLVYDYDINGYSGKTKEFASGTILIGKYAKLNASGDEQYAWVLTVARIYDSNWETKVLYPDGGEKIESGSMCTIRAETVPGDTGCKLRFYYSVDDNLYNYIGEKTLPAEQSTVETSINWTVPNVVTNKARIKVEKIVEVNGVPTVTEIDYSDSTFSIYYPNVWISVNFPKATDTFYPGDTVNVSWTKNGNFNYYKIYYIVGDQENFLGTTYSSSFSFNAPNIESDAKIKVEGYGNEGLLAVGYSETFKFKELRVRLLTPVPGERIKAGTTYKIQWEANTDFDSFTLYFSPDAQKTWTEIATLPGNKREYLWQVPWVSSRECIIKIVGVRKGNQIIDYTGD